MKRLIAILAVCLGLAGAGVQAASLPPCQLAGPYQSCTESALQRLGDDMQAAGTQVGQEIGTRLKALKANLDSARAQLFESHLSGEALTQAKARLEDLLSQKDYYLALVDLMLAPKGGISNDALGNSMAASNYQIFAQFDGNVPEFSRGAFNDWTRATEERARFGAARTITNPIARYTAAMQETGGLYQHYELARDWGEYAAHGCNLTDDPRLYALALISLRGPRWGGDDSKLQMSTAYYSAVVNVFGQESLDKAVRLVMSYHKNREGRLEPAYRVSGADYADVWTALWASLAETSLRNYVLAQLSMFQGGLLGNYYPADITKATELYEGLKEAYGGEAAVLKVAKIVHDAPKTGEGYLSDPLSVGASNIIPKRAIEQILSGSNSASGESGTIENPAYALWAPFKTGAVAIYAVSAEVPDRKGAQSASEGLHVELYKLISVDKAVAKLECGQYVAESGKPGLVAQSSVPKNILHSIAGADGPDQRGSISDRYVAPQETGTETLKINGKTFDTHWERRGTQVRWYSKDVPGGLVLSKSRGGETIVYQPGIIDLNQIHSINDLRIEVTSVSGGEYATLGQPQLADKFVGARVDLQPIDTMTLEGVQERLNYRTRLTKPIVAGGQTLVPAGTDFFIRADGVSRISKDTYNVQRWTASFKVDGNAVSLRSGSALDEFSSATPRPSGAHIYLTLAAPVASNNDAFLANAPASQGAASSPKAPPNISGQYKGSYSCTNSGPNSVVVDLKQDGNKLTAIFTSSTPGLPPMKMWGTFVAQTNHVALHQQGPASGLPMPRGGLFAPDMYGAYDETKRTLTGQFSPTQCGAFSLARAQ